MQNINWPVSTHTELTPTHSSIKTDAAKAHEKHLIYIN